MFVKDTIISSVTLDIGDQSLVAVEFQIFLISPKGIRERRCLRCRIQFSMCHYLGGGFHGRRKRVKAQSESSKSVVNSVLISREMPVFPGFLEIISVVHKKTAVMHQPAHVCGFSNVPGAIRTRGLSLRSRPDTMKPSATQCKKILGNTRFFTVSNPIWYHAS